MSNVEFHESRVAEAEQFHEKQKRRKEAKAEVREKWHEKIITASGVKVVEKYKTEKGVQSIYLGTWNECKNMKLKFKD